MKRLNKIGSATVVVIMFCIAFMLYASSTFADVRHLKNKYTEYERDIINTYEQQYNDIVEGL